MADYSEAIQKGVYEWLAHNAKDVKDIIEEATKKSVDARADKATEAVATGFMLVVAKFFDDNRAEIITAIAAAAATSYQSRVHKNDAISS